jgi:hypothetical protein
MSGGQFGTMDNLMDRRELFELLRRVGEKDCEAVQAIKRARVLRALMAFSDSPLAPMTQPQPMSMQEAWGSFVAITGVLGVSISEAAAQLEELARAG